MYLNPEELRALFKKKKKPKKVYLFEAPRRPERVQEGDPFTKAGLMVHLGSRCDSV